MPERIIPRCPKCNKRLLNWLEGNASFTCQNSHCKTKFEIVDGRVLVVAPVILAYHLKESST